jgi:hypothetical protein
MAMVTPVMAMCAEIGRMRSAVDLPLRRCRGRIDQHRAESQERCRDNGSRNPTPHDGLLLQIIQMRAAISPNSWRRGRQKRARSEADPFAFLAIALTSDSSDGDDGGGDDDDDASGANDDDGGDDNDGGDVASALPSSPVWYLPERPPQRQDC